MLATLHMDVSTRRRRCRQLSIGQKQMIEIAKAISYQCQDHHHGRADRLAQPPRGRHADGADPQACAQQGIGIVYITHRLDEIFEIADRVTILRDGSTVDSLPIAEVTRDILVRKMVDRELQPASTASIVCHATSEVLLDVRGPDAAATRGRIRPR